MGEVQRQRATGIDRETAHGSPATRERQRRVCIDRRRTAEGIGPAQDGRRAAGAAVHIARARDNPAIGVAIVAAKANCASTIDSNVTRILDGTRRRSITHHQGAATADRESSRPRGSARDLQDATIHRGQTAIAIGPTQNHRANPDLLHGSGTIDRLSIGEGLIDIGIENDAGGGSGGDSRVVGADIAILQSAAIERRRAVVAGIARTALLALRNRERADAVFDEVQDPGAATLRAQEAVVERVGIGSADSERAAQGVVDGHTQKAGVANFGNFDDTATAAILNRCDGFIKAEQAQVAVVGIGADKAHRSRVGNLFVRTEIDDAPSAVVLQTADLEVAADGVEGGRLVEGERASNDSGDPGIGVGGAATQDEAALNVPWTVCRRVGSRVATVLDQTARTGNSAGEIDLIVGRRIVVRHINTPHATGAEHEVVGHSDGIICVECARARERVAVVEKERRPGIEPGGTPIHRATRAAEVHRLRTAHRREAAAFTRE